MIGVGVVAAVAVAGFAFAYWTGSGSGEGTGTVGTSATVTLTGTIAPGLAPGTASAVTFTAANDDSSPVQVTEVQLQSIAVDGPHAGCDTGDMTMADVTENHAVPANATAEALPVDGSLVYANTGVNQDACQGATVTLTLTSS